MKLSTVQALSTRIRMLLGLALLLISGLTMASSFTFKTIDVPGAAQTRAFGINNAGHIVGSYLDPTTQHGFLLRGGAFTTIDFPLPPPLPIDFLTIAYGINSRDQIVGTYNVSPGLPFAFFFSGGTYRTISSSQVLISEARGINDLRDICGLFAFTDQPGIHSYLLTKNVLTIIDVPGATFTRAFGINDLRHIVGNYVDAGGTTHGFLRQGGRITTIDRPGATSTSANGINIFDKIVGSYTDAGGTHGFLLVKGKFTTIDIPGATSTEAWGINAFGVIVGTYQNASGTHGFIARRQLFGGRDGDNDDENKALKSPFAY